MKLRDAALFAFLSLGAVASPARADWTFFLPIPIGHRISLEGAAFREEDRIESAAGESGWEDEFFREKVILESNGYWYSPRFLLYDVSLGFGFRQERFRILGGEAARRDGAAREYDLRLTLLPEHPYNLIVHASRFEPLTREKSARPFHSVETREGVTFRFRDKPWFVTASYLRNRLAAEESHATTTQADADAEYFRRLLSGDEISFTAGAKRTSFEAGTGLGGSSDELHAGNLLNFGKVRLSSDASRSSFSQGEGALGLGSRQILLHQRLTSDLPWRFRSELSWRWRRSESRFERASGVRSFTDTQTEALFRLSHRLFRSLDTTLSLGRTDRRSDGGASASTTASFLASYVKLVPRGSLLSTLSLSSVTVDNRGSGGDVVDEAHPGVSVPTEWIRLAVRDVAPGSILVTVRSSLPPHERLLLAEGEHYVIRADAASGVTEILVHALPAELPVPGGYDVFLSYSTNGGGWSLRTDSASAGASLDLFANRVTPYASWSEIRTEVLSGTPGGAALDGTSLTFGLRLQQGPVRLSLERQRQTSEISPYEAWKAELIVSATAGPDTSVYLSALHQDRNRHPGQADAIGYRERIDSVTGHLRQRMRFLGGTTASVGGAFSRTRGLVDATAWSANAALAWQLGRLDVSAGANASSTSTDRGEAGSFRRDHTTYYLRIRREIF